MRLSRTCRLLLPAAILVGALGRPGGAGVVDAIYLAQDGSFGPTLTGSLGERFEPEEDGGLWQPAAGVRLGPVAVEIPAGVLEVHDRAPVGSEETELTMYLVGVSVRGYVPVWKSVELYGRAGIDWGNIRGCENEPRLPFTGLAYGAGVDVAYRQAPQGLYVSLRVDYGREHIRLPLSESDSALTGSLDRLVLGFAIGATLR